MVDFDPTIDWLPWFLAHPWELTQYACSRKWEEYQQGSGKGRYELLRDLQSASRNQGKVSLYRDHQYNRECAVKVVPRAFVVHAAQTNDTEQPLCDSGTLRYLTYFGDGRHVPKWIDCGVDNDKVSGGHAQYLGSSVRPSCALSCLSDCRCTS
jgi:hypothetical protein